jgi:hypothetical protein
VASTPERDSASTGGQHADAEMDRSHQWRTQRLNAFGQMSKVVESLVLVLHRQNQAKGSMTRTGSLAEMAHANVPRGVENDPFVA